MAAKNTNKVVIRVVRKTHRTVHHGGSWKVAYADFVTALMAFFLVMWILGMDQQLKRAVEGYFSNPVGYKHGFGSGKSPISSGTSPAHVQTTPVHMVSFMRQERDFVAARERIRGALQGSVALGSLAAHVQVVVTRAGLRIELAEGENDDELFFRLGSAELRPPGRGVLDVIGRELAVLTNPVIIEGHTDAAQYGAGRYGNWELSTERANEARRVLESAGLPPARVAEVKGLADRDLRDPAHPLSAANRRITILLPFTVSPDGDSASADRRPTVPLVPATNVGAS